jgi:hypothetical protein
MLLQLAVGLKISRDTLHRALKVITSEKEDKNFKTTKNSLS